MGTRDDIVKSMAIDCSLTLRARCEKITPSHVRLATRSGAQLRAPARRMCTATTHEMSEVGGRSHKRLRSVGRSGISPNSSPSLHGVLSLSITSLSLLSACSSTRIKNNKDARHTHTHTLEPHCVRRGFSSFRGSCALRARA